MVLGAVFVHSGFNLQQWRKPGETDCECSLYVDNLDVYVLTDRLDTICFTQYQHELTSTTYSM